MYRLLIALGLKELLAICLSGGCSPPTCLLFARLSCPLLGGARSGRALGRGARAP